jgi:hypothetical protein
MLFRSNGTTLSVACVGSGIECSKRALVGLQTGSVGSVLFNAALLLQSLGVLCKPVLRTSAT